MGYLRLIGLKIQILASHIHQQTFQMQNTFKVYFTLKMKKDAILIKSTLI